MMDDLPYRVEYSKSGRAGCKVCKTPIAKDSLRIATVVQSPFHDGKLERWHHVNCFFQKQRPTSVGDIAHFDNIRWEDQEFITKKIDTISEDIVAPIRSGKSSRKRTKAAAGTESDFRVEYAKSNRSKCRGCEETIVKDEVRISKKDYETEEARKFGGLDRWHHAECFVKLRAELSFFEAATSLPGHDSLSKSDKETLLKLLPKIKQEALAPSIKKIKSEPTDREEEKQLKDQSKKLFVVRDKLSALNKKTLIKLLEANKQSVPTGINEILDALADAIYFGALEPCTKCNGQFQYKSGTGYKCTGNITEWALCENITQDPKRRKFHIHKELKEHSFLSSYKFQVRQRILKIRTPSTLNAVKKESELNHPKVQSKPRPLKYLDFVIVGKTIKNKEDLKKEILLMGGNVKLEVTENTAAVIATTAEVEKLSRKIRDAKQHDIHVVSEDFVEEAKAFTDIPTILFKNKSIAPWGADPTMRISKSVAIKSTAKSKSTYEKSLSGKVKLCVKGGVAVDPDSGLDDIAHVYQSGETKFTTTLGLTDIQTKRNSFYKLQILKHDKKNKYYLFRSWGRIGTTIGGKMCDSLELDDCISMFKKLYEEKSGNLWKNRDTFVKIPKKLYPIDIDNGDDLDSSNIFESNIESKLKKPVQNLIRMIFNVNSMKKAMLEYEIDLNKMPLGKITKKQIQQAYLVLTELLVLVKEKNIDRSKFISASNKFYTLIPHNFGIKEPSIIETESEIQSKSEMLESLLEMEIAYDLLNVKADTQKNPLDTHYEQLKTDIDVLNKKSDEFKLIEQYIKNTHAETHKQFELIIEEVFIIKRNGEERRYKPFKKLSNRKLLWHGSRVTNFAGILSQGLRIAPPEAPVTGYMFGKGIYFADMVSKSANYCCTSAKDSKGLLLLCDVALGNMHELYHANYIEKLPNGKHSTWGRGKTQPDPEKSVKLKNGVEVPCGRTVPAELKQDSSLLYNEFIVYDVAQVKVEYIVKLDFKYKF